MKIRTSGRNCISALGLPGRTLSLRRRRGNQPIHREPPARRSELIRPEKSGALYTGAPTHTAGPADGQRLSTGDRRSTLHRSFRRSLGTLLVHSTLQALAPCLRVEVLVILFLILLNGFFALSEMALVSAKRSRLQAAAEQGKIGREVGARAHGRPDDAPLRDPDRHHPDRHLSPASTAAPTLAAPLAGTLAGYGVPARYARRSPMSSSC